LTFLGTFFLHLRGQAAHVSGRILFSLFYSLKDRPFFPFFFQLVDGKQRAAFAKAFMYSLFFFSRRSEVPIFFFSSFLGDQKKPLLLLSRIRVPERMRMRCFFFFPPRTTSRTCSFSSAEEFPLLSFAPKEPNPSFGGYEPVLFPSLSENLFFSKNRVLSGIHAEGYRFLLELRQIVSRRVFFSLLDIRPELVLSLVQKISPFPFSLPFLLRGGLEPFFPTLGRAILPSHSEMLETFFFLGFWSFPHSLFQR